MRWRPSWFSLKGKVGFQGQGQASYVSPPCSATDYLRATYCPARLVDPVDDLVFAVALVEAEVQAQLGGQRPAVPLHVGQGLVALDVRLPLAQQVQVGAVEYEDEAAHRGFPNRSLASSWPGMSPCCNPGHSPKAILALVCAGHAAR